MPPFRRAARVGVRGSRGDWMIAGGNVEIWRNRIAKEVLKRYQTDLLLEGEQ